MFSYVPHKALKVTISVLQLNSLINTRIKSTLNKMNILLLMKCGIQHQSIESIQRCIYNEQARQSLLLNSQSLENAYKYYYCQFPLQYSTNFS